MEESPILNFLWIREAKHSAFLFPQGKGNYVGRCSGNSGNAEGNLKDLSSGGLHAFSPQILLLRVTATTKNDLLVIHSILLARNILCG